MLEKLSYSQTKDVLEIISHRIIANQDALNKADREIGDGDHGTAMVRGFTAVLKILEQEEHETLQALFIAAGNAMIASVGGCAGIIFGTFFRSGGKALDESMNLDATGFSKFLSGAYQAVKARGKANLGDKTMLDALHPAVEEAKKSQHLDFPVFIHAVAEAAREGMMNTGQLLASTGRAKDFGKNAIGKLDPGSITLYWIIDCFDAYINKIPSL